MSNNGLVSCDESGGKEQMQWHAKVAKRPESGAAAKVAGQPNTNPPALDPLEGTAETRQLCQEISEASGGICFFGFSRGKDSIAAWLFLRRFFKRIIPFHCASVPHLRFVDESLAYYERVFETPILRLMDGQVLGAVDDLVWQPPGSEPIIDELELWHYDMHDVVDLLRQRFQLPNAWCAYAISMFDSIYRRCFVGRCGGRFPRRKSFYPCYNWRREQVIEAVKASGIKLPVDYRMGNRSFSGRPTYHRHLGKIEEMFPDDYARIEAMFPMIKAEYVRQVFRAKYWQPPKKAETSEPKPSVTDANV